MKRSPALSPKERVRVSTKKDSGKPYLKVSILLGNETYGLPLSFIATAHRYITNKNIMESRKNTIFCTFAFMCAPEGNLEELLY
jgi:hypothetical protein